MNKKKVVRKGGRRSAAARVRGGWSGTGSFLSVGSILSFASVFSVGSSGSILSIGSAGSILCLGCSGSILSIGKSGAVLNKKRGERDG